MTTAFARNGIEPPGPVGARDLVCEPFRNKPIEGTIQRHAIDPYALVPRRLLDFRMSEGAFGGEQYGEYPFSGFGRTTTNFYDATFDRVWLLVGVRGRKHACKYRASCNLVAHLS